MGTSVASTFDDLGLDDNEAVVGGLVRLNFAGAELSVAGYGVDFSGTGTATGDFEYQGSVGYGWGHVLSAAYALHWLCFASARYCHLQLHDLELARFFGYASGGRCSRCTTRTARTTTARTSASNSCSSSCAALDRAR